MLYSTTVVEETADKEVASLGNKKKYRIMTSRETNSLEYECKAQKNAMAFYAIDEEKSYDYLLFFIMNRLKE